MDYIDTYLKSKSKEALEALRGSVVNSTPVQPYQPEQSVQDEDGNTTLIPAAGTPEYYYCCVRAVFPVPTFDDIELSTYEEAAPVCGTWS